MINLKKLLLEALEEIAPNKNYNLDDGEKAVVIKLAKDAISKEKDQENIDGLNLIIQMASKPGPFDVSVLFTDPKLSSYSGMALDELMTDWILLRSNTSPILSNQERQIARKLDMKWQRISFNGFTHGSKQK